MPSTEIKVEVHWILTSVIIIVMTIAIIVIILIIISAIILVILVNMLIINISDISFIHRCNMNGVNNSIDRITIMVEPL